MSGLTTIKLSSEDLKKEQERQRKRGRLIFKTFKKGKVKVVVGRYDEDGTVPDMIFQYQIHDAHFRSIVDYTNGEVICVMDCYYDDIDIFNEDGSEITEKLPLWLLSEIENKIEDKFASFNIELRYMQQSDGKGKKSLVYESEEEEDQKMIHKAKLIYRALRKGKIEINYGDGNSYSLKTIDWILPNKFKLKVKSYDYQVAQKLGREKYVVLVLDSQTIDIVTNDGKPITNGENFSMVMKINEQFKKHNITVYWSGGSSLPDPESTQIDLTSKSK
jgi:protein required for attachment to host cells